MASIWAELKRRNVVKVAAAYAIVAWLLIQIASTTFPILGLPEWTVTLVTVLLMIGLPVALILAWAYELTPQGPNRDRDANRSASISRKADRKLDHLILGILAAVILYFLADRFYRTDSSETLAPRAAEQSVAVLPFLNMSSDSEQEYFSDGISEEILNQLAKIRGLQVAGRTSSFAFKGQNEDLRIVGEKLSVANILEGSVRKSGNRVRITVQLIKTKDGYHLWSESFDRELTDIFTIQDEISKAVATALSIALGVGESGRNQGGTQNFDAYDVYLAGLSFSRRLTPDGTIQAIDYLEKAVSLDPDYAKAWSALAQTYRVAANFYIADRTEELRQKAEAAAKRAVDIAPEAVAPLVAVAQVQMGNHQWTQAGQALEKAFGLSPADFEANLYYGIFLLNVGRPQDAIEHFRRAARAEPLLFNPVSLIAFTHDVSGEFDLAMAEYRKGSDMIGNRAFQHLLIAVLGMESGDRALLRDAVESALASPDIADNVHDFNETMLSLVDNEGAAKSELQRLSEDAASNFPLLLGGIAAWASYFDEPEIALKAYQKLFEIDASLVYVAWRPIDFKARRLPDFGEMVRDLGLVDYWRSTGNWGAFCQPTGNTNVQCK